MLILEYNKERRIEVAQGQIKESNTRYSLTIDKDLKSRLEKLAKEEKRSLNNMIIYCLEKYLNNIEK